MRFISVILDPGRIWSDHGVIDTHKNICVCRSSDSGHAESIAKCLNLQWLAKGGDAPIALLAPSYEDLDAEIAKSIKQL